MCLPRDGTEDADLDRVAADRDRVAGRALETTHCPFEVAYCGRQTVHILVEKMGLEKICLKKGDLTYILVYFLL